MSHFSDNIGLFNVDLSNVSLNYVNFHDNDPNTIIHVRLMVWCNRYKHCITCKADSKELMPLA